MVNPRFIDLAKRQRSTEAPQEPKGYPSPDEYAMPRDDYFEHLRQRDSSHPSSVENALSIIRGFYNEMREDKDISGLVVAAVGSSLTRHDYKDIDLVLLGIPDMELGRELFDRTDALINGTRPNQNEGGEFTFNYIGVPVGPSWTGGPSTSDSRDDYLIDLTFDESGRSFYEWHKMMVNSDQPYSIVGRDMEEEQNA